MSTCLSEQFSRMLPSVTSSFLDPLASRTVCFVPIKARVQCDGAASSLFIQCIVFLSFGACAPSLGKIKAVPAAAALPSPAPFSPQKRDQLDHVEQQQRAAGDQGTAADDDAGGLDAGGRC